MWSWRRDNWIVKHHWIPGWRPGAAKLCNNYILICGLNFPTWLFLQTNALRRWLKHNVRIKQNKCKLCSWSLGNCDSPRYTCAEPKCFMGRAQAVFLNCEYKYSPRNLCVRDVCIQDRILKGHELLCALNARVGDFPVWPWAKSITSVGIITYNYFDNSNNNNSCQLQCFPVYEVFSLNYLFNFYVSLMG